MTPVWLEKRVPECEKKEPQNSCFFPTHTHTLKPLPRLLLLSFSKLEVNQDFISQRQVEIKGGANVEFGFNSD